MQILGIDPGASHVGIVLVQSTGDTIPEIVEHYSIDERFDPVGDVPGMGLFYEIHDRLKGLALVAIEDIEARGQIVGRDTLLTAIQIGRLIEFFDRFHVCLFAPRSVHVALCGITSPKPAQIRQAIIDLYPPTGGGSEPRIGTERNPGPLHGIKYHEWSALAVALTCWHANQRR